MPTQQIPSNEELLTLSEQLKRRLTTATRGKKSSLPAELRQELMVALDHMAELALEASIVELDANRQSAEVVLHEDGQSESTAELTAGGLPSQAPISLSAEELSRIVSEAVVGSLATWQTEFSASLSKLQPEPATEIVANDGPAQSEPDELTLMLLQELNQELSETRIQLTAANSELSDTRIQLTAANSELSDTRTQLTAANSELSDCQSQLKEYRKLLERAEYRIAEVELEPLHASANDDDLSDQLKLQLEETLDELSELRQQNSELAAKLAHQAANSVTSGSATGRGKDAQLTWEERKLLILKQLETDPSDAQTDGIESIESCDRLQLQEVLDASKREIARRDAEIDELREIVQMQSEARAGLAIGAAGISQLIDSDELIQQERQKLQDIQKEWETKLRQAEIDLSMERAKIARERLAMEKEKDELSRIEPASSVPKERTIENRWLRILGINPETKTE